MRTKFVVDNETKHYEKQWIMSTWYEKTYYVVGMIVTLFTVISFTAGFIIGFIEEML